MRGIFSCFFSFFGKCYDNKILNFAVKKRGKQLDNINEQQNFYYKSIGVEVIWRGLTRV